MNIPFIFLFTSMLNSLSAHATQREAQAEDKNRNRATNEWFNNLTPENPEWREIATRDPNDPIIHPYYLQRLLRGIQEIFTPWLEEDESSPMNYLSFREVLKQQHLELVTGKDGGSPYLGFTRIEHGIPILEPIPPGQFRHELVNRNLSEHIMPYQIRSKLKKEEMSSRLQELIDAYIDNPAIDKMQESTEIMPQDFYEGPHASLDVIQLPRLERLKFGVWNKIYSQYIAHHYPRHEDKEAILSAMKKVAADIKIQLKKIPLHKPDTVAHALSLIEEYLYLGAHAHPFESANFSIIMGQVNLMLSRFGLKGICPSNIDYIALSEQFPEFKIAFRKKLKAVNPHIIFFPIHTNRSPFISILAHIGEEIGDHYFAEGELIENTKNAERKKIEGLMIIPTLPPGVTLEYQGHIQLEGFTPWIPARNFMGTHGQSKALEGVAFRLRGLQSYQYTIHYLVRLSDSEWIKICKNGEFCGTTTTGKPITGLKIWITQHNYR